MPTKYSLNLLLIFAVFYYTIVNFYFSSTITFFDFGKINSPSPSNVSRYLIKSSL